MLNKFRGDPLSTSLNTPRLGLVFGNFIDISVSARGNRLFRVINASWAMFCSKVLQQGFAARAWAIATVIAITIPITVAIAVYRC